MGYPRFGSQYSIYDFIYGGEGLCCFIEICIAVIIIWILSFLAITKINATEAHMFEHYMIQVCLKYCKMINECLLGKIIFFKIELCFFFFLERGRVGP